MNIGFIYGQPIYPPTSGGSIHGYQLAKNLCALGYSLRSYYFGQETNHLVRHYRGRQILSFIFGIEALYARAEWKQDIARLAYLKKLRANKIPLILEFNGTPHETLYGGSSSRDIDMIEQRLRKLARHVDGAIAVSAEIGSYVESSLGIDNTIVIPNGSDPEIFFPSARKCDDNSPLVVAWVGTTAAPWQDLESLFRAAKTLETMKANVSFWVIGDEKQLPSSLPRNILTKGVIPYRELGAVLNQADIGIHIFKETAGQPVHGSPLKIFDYMACGLAIVTQLNGQRGAIINRWQAGFPTTGTPEDIVRVLLHIERNREQARLKGLKARKAVLDEFSWRITAQRTDEFIRKLVSN